MAMPALRGEAVGGKRPREGRRSEFTTHQLHVTFQAHVAAAQSAFLQGDTPVAEREAMLALRIRPTAHLFALLAVIAEAKGKFEQASEFRLLQAFLARDMVLWEELLHDFMSQQLYYKSVVCLQRMSTLEQNPERYRALQLQLADLLVGLGEVRRASNVLVPLWNSSRCRDFEVFALLASLYFQLGKWTSLQRLIESSVRHAFHVTPPTVVSAENPTDEVPPHASSRSKAPQQPSKPPPPHRVSKRIRFFGLDQGEADATADVVAKEGTPSEALTTPVASPSPSLEEFRFDKASSSPCSVAPSCPPFLNPTTDAPLPPSGGSEHRSVLDEEKDGNVAYQLYGEHLCLRTAQDRRNFLTLINVHAELLNEQGSFSDTVRLLHMAAGCLEVDLMELPPDLLVRLGVAYGFLGGVYEQPCRDVFQHLMEHCAMEDYGDVLLDAATSLQKVGMHADAAQVFATLARYHRFVYDRLQSETHVGAAELALMEETALPEKVRRASEALASLQAEEADVKTVLAAALHGQAQSAYAQELYDEARLYAEQVLELEPAHLQARLLLGRYHFYQCRDTAAAVRVLTPTEHEPALQRLQLGAFLVSVFQRARRYVEAIALGVSIFELLFSSEEDGDTQSVAPGTSSRRSGSSLLLPTMTRASSAIIPASTLAGMVGRSGPTGTGRAVSRTSHSLAASIKASTSVAHQQLSRRGLASLTTTVYGASAAASLATGWTREEEEEERWKDTSTIFRFHRRRRPRRLAEGDVDLTTATKSKSSEPLPSLEGAEAEAEHAASPSTSGEAPQPRPKTAQDRQAELITMDPDAFWLSAAAGPGSAAAADPSAPSSCSSPIIQGKAEEGKKKTEDIEGGEEEKREGPPVRRVKVEEAPKEVELRRGDTTLTGCEASAPPCPHQGNEEVDAGEQVELAFTKEKGPVKSSRKRTSRAVAPRRSNNTTVGERERDLEELEEFLTEAEKIVAQHPNAGRAVVGGRGDDVLVDGEEEAEQGQDSVSDTDVPLDAGQLPSLEEVSRQFQDPAMAQLFLNASSFTPGGGVHCGEGGEEEAEVGSPSWATMAGMRDSPNDAVAAAAVEDKVTLRDAIAVLGQAGFLSLAVAVVECYSAVGQFTEAREFAFVALAHFAQKRRLRQMGSHLERPLRLAVLRAALAAGESEDAYRVGLRLLQEDTEESKRHVVVELLHSVLNRCYDRSSILYRAVADGYGDPAILVLLANRYHQTRSYTRVLNLYLAALQERPTDIFLNFMVGLAYLFCSHQKRTRTREACVSAAIYYLTQYQQLRLALEPSAAVGEVLYNIARALQFMRLHHLCIPLYERVAYDLAVPSECSAALRRAARVNLYFLFRWVSGNRTLALSALQPRYAGPRDSPNAAAATAREGGGGEREGPRSPSPFRPR